MQLRQVRDLGGCKEGGERRARRDGGLDGVCELGDRVAEDADDGGDEEADLRGTEAEEAACGEPLKSEECEGHLSMCGKEGSSNPQ